MLDKKILEQDLDEICRMTNSRWKKYSDLCRYNENAEPLEMKSFLAEMEQFLGPNYKLHLLNSSIIAMRPGGGYDFVFDNGTMSGGGISYLWLGDNADQRYMIFFDDDNDYNMRIVYHEAGHCLQAKFNYFDDRKLEKIYRFCDKGMTKADRKRKLPRLFADILSYERYLKEMHAEAFSNCCMLLRAEDKKDFNRLCRKMMFFSASLSLDAIKSEDTEYSGGKCYFTYPLIKNLIKRLRQEYQTGEIQKYYSGKHKINFKFLADEMEEFVLEQALSPRTFLQLLTNDRKGESYDFENKWQHLLPEIKIRYYAGSLTYKDIKSTIKKSIQINKERAAAILPKYKSLSPVDEDSRLFNVVCPAVNALNRLNYMMLLKEVSFSAFPELDPCLAVRHGGFPKPAARKALAKLTSCFPDNVAFWSEVIGKYEKSLNNIDFGGVDKDMAAALVALTKQPSGHEAVWELYHQKAEGINTINLKALSRKGDEELAEKSTYVLSYKLRSCLNKLKHKDNNKQAEELLRNDILQAICQNPENLADDDWRCNLEQKHITQENKDNAGWIVPLTRDNISDCLDEIYLLYYQNPHNFAQMVARYKEREAKRGCIQASLRQKEYQGR